MQLVGLQELACGIGILSTRRPAGWVWARVAGDAVHLTMLGGAMASGPPEPERMAAATAAVVGITALDAYDAVQLSRQSEAADETSGGGPFEVHQTITIGRPAEELYRFWRDFENLPRFMRHLESVQAVGEWAVALGGEGPGRDDGRVGRRDHRGSAERADRLALASRAPTSTTPGRCASCRAPGGRGTEVRVELRYDPPGGAARHVRSPSSSARSRSSRCRTTCAASSR